MSFFEDIKKLQQQDIALGVVLFLGTLAPGTLILQTFYATLVKDLDVVKLTLLSFAITLPVTTLNTILSGVGTRDLAKPGPFDLTPHAVAGFVISSFVFYVPLVVRLFLPISQTCFATIAAVVEALIVILTVIDVIQKKRHKA